MSKRVSPAQRLQAEIDGVFAGGEDLAGAIEQVALVGPPVGWGSPSHVIIPSDLPVFEGTYVRLLLHRRRDTTVQGTALAQGDQQEPVTVVAQVRVALEERLLVGPSKTD